MKNKKVRRVLAVGLVVVVLLPVTISVTSCVPRKDSRGKLLTDYKYVVSYVPPGGLGCSAVSTIFYYTNEEPTLEGEDRIIRNYRRQVGDFDVSVGIETRVPVRFSSVTKQY